ncbi:MAG TPA: PilC/PilY family type IV pilus protein [Burkholderiaceae bacterium]|nr:PilC/PilY family type IV pilus protein [Burkholderiaceae bacterium]HMX09901.1 PilC/PilY family type IV pilus protein [Burkholderiaceae bacterium]HMY98777.1 PilC/PilY family type IV pilus protein [Burkholderiaceae bacterium]HNB43363.1 PilC/PilY family type IV pilus protein [Burkholderiaceae bacterium]HNG78982.1 PilC/PilY family type IV pilus protein [Burkholderiaceae bacterium]
MSHADFPGARPGPAHPLRRWGPIVLAAVVAPAGALTLAEAPLFLTSTVKPNVLVIYDNSQSMDGTMSGRVIAGDDATTRGNIARSVLRNSITTYRSAFNWGLESFALKSAPALNTTYAYYFGADADVVYTNSCVGGVSPANGNRRCVANPEPGNGFNFITYARSGDDADINDVLYNGTDLGPQMYGIGVAGTSNYWVWQNHSNWAGNGWTAGSFFNGWNQPWTYTPTDAGFLPQTPPYSRLFYLRRAWGYMTDITGSGVISEAVAVDGTTHYNNLMSLLASETANAGTGEIKNAATYTPLAGSLATAGSYFSNTLAGSTTPVTATCQRNFVLLATDGNPTGRADGTMYSLADQANTYNAGTGTWTFGTAATDVFAQISALRSTTISNSAAINGNYDVSTYVIGLGDTVANASSIATLNRMALLGGTKVALLASDSAGLTSALDLISRDIIARTGAAATVTLNAGSWSSGTQVYQARFSSGDWSGQLLSYAMASDGSLAASPTWDSGQRLNAQNWSSGRQIATYKASGALGSRGVPFRWPANAASPTSSEIDASMVTALNKNASGTADGYGSQRLEWLRGNTALEQRNCSSCSAPVFRSRPVSVLGDIINSSPVNVTGGGRYLRDSIEAATYSTYKVARTAKQALIAVGANDGMLHLFKASNGDEVFAYVPAAVATRLSLLTDPAYSHRYTVDGSPTTGDVFYSSAWHTVLTGGFGAGAKGLYNLDLSDPALLTESNAANVVRWEIDGSDADVGNIFQAPVLAKMKNGRWMAITGNGYNSSNGSAVLLLVDIETGAVTKVDTQTPGSNGLSSVAAVSSSNNGVADVVYAGDLAGNLWKFDLSSATPSQWAVAYKQGSTPKPLYAAGQPITARPDVTPHPSGGYLVMFGTGRYVDTSDNAAGSAQALYGIRDNGSTVSSSQIVAQSILGTTTGADGRSYRISTHAVGAPGATTYIGDNTISTASYTATKFGWQLALPASGERIVTQTAVRYGKVVASTLIPSSAPCSYGGDGWLIEVDVLTGNRSDSPALDSNGDNLVDAADMLSYSGGHAYASGVRMGAIPAAPGFIRAQNRRLDDKLINTSDGSVVRVREAGNAAVSGRVSWEQLQ